MELLDLTELLELTELPELPELNVDDQAFDFLMDITDFFQGLQEQLAEFATSFFGIFGF